MNQGPGLTYANLQAAVTAMGYAFFDRGDYNLNLIGIRTDDNRSELFNDWLVVAFRQNDHEQLWLFPMTTDPGTYWRKHPMNAKGTAILAPGQYRGCWELGLHKGEYEALVQRGPMTVWRDNDRNATLDLGPADDGHHGINLHKAGRLTDTDSKVGRWSAGCQVLPRTDDFALLMSLVKQAAKRYGPRFTYTLLTEAEAWPRH